MRLRRSRPYKPPPCTQIRSINKPSPMRRAPFLSLGLLDLWVFSQLSPALRLWQNNSCNSCNPTNYSEFSSSPWFFPIKNFHVKIPFSLSLCCALSFYTHPLLSISLVVWIDRPIARDEKCPPQRYLSLGMTYKLKYLIKNVNWGIIHLTYFSIFSCFKYNKDQSL